MVSFLAPWKHQKSFVFLIFSGGIEKYQRMKWVNNKYVKTKTQALGESQQQHYFDVLNARQVSKW